MVEILLSAWNSRILMANEFFLFFVLVHQPIFYQCFVHDRFISELMTHSDLSDFYVDGGPLSHFIGLWVANLSWYEKSASFQLLRVFCSRLFFLGHFKKIEIHRNGRIGVHFVEDQSLRPNFLEVEREGLFSFVFTIRCDLFLHQDCNYKWNEWKYIKASLWICHVLVFPFLHHGVWAPNVFDP